MHSIRPTKFTPDSRATAIHPVGRRLDAPIPTSYLAAPAATTLLFDFGRVDLERDSVVNAPLRTARLEESLGFQ